MKKEEIYLHTYQDFEECRKALFEYIEFCYNRKRIHSALGYKTPQQVADEAEQEVNPEWKLELSDDIIVPKHK